MSNPDLDAVVASTPCRRRLLGTLAALAAVPAGVGTARGDCPDVEVDCFQVTLGAYEDVDRVEIHTDDGSTLTYDGELDGDRFGYYPHLDYQFEAWYGLIDRVEVTRDNRTVVVRNDEQCPEFELGCDRLETDYGPNDLRLYFEHATKRYDPPVGDRPVYGAPGQTLESVVEMSDERTIYLDDCVPEADPGVVFDCTSVTVRPEEFLNGRERFYNAELTFVDGEIERIGDRETEFTPPETFEGSGENEGKVIERLVIWNDVYGEAIFSYSNPDLDECGTDPTTTPTESQTTETAVDGDTGAAPTTTPAGRRDDGESIANETETDADGGNSTTDDTSNAAPGLGALAALGGLGGAVAYLHSRISHNRKDR